MYLAAVLCFFISEERSCSSSSHPNPINNDRERMGNSPQNVLWLLKTISKQESWTISQETLIVFFFLFNTQKTSYNTIFTVQASYIVYLVYSNLKKRKSLQCQFLTFNDINIQREANRRTKQTSELQTELQKNCTEEHYYSVWLLPHDWWIYFHTYNY